MEVDLFDRLLTEEEKEKMLERDEDLQFATIAYSMDGRLVIDHDTEEGVSGDVPGY